MTINGRRICVTGAAGFIGRSLCEALLLRGAQVIALDNFSVGRRDSLAAINNDIEIVTADIRNPADLRDALTRSDIVFHLAAINDRLSCRKDFGLAFDVNIRGTANVLAMCADVEKVIFGSSAMVYGEPRYLPVDERHPADGYDPYAVSKIAAEQLFKAFYFLKQTRFTIVRNTNTFGPGQAPETLIPSLILEGVTHGNIQVWTPGVVRDFQYIEDCVDGLIAIAASDATLGETINLGGGRAISTGEVADVICGHLGVTWMDMRKPSPVSGRLFCDTTKLKALTGWEPKVGFDQGMKMTIDYYVVRAGRSIVAGPM